MLGDVCCIYEYDTHMLRWIETLNPHKSISSARLLEPKPTPLSLSLISVESNGRRVWDLLIQSIAENLKSHRQFTSSN